MTRALQILLRLGLVGLLAIALTSCRARATVSIRVDDDGSGTVAVRVQLDADAVRAVEGIDAGLEEAVPLDDLVAAGWAVEPWVLDDDGGAAFTMRKEFAGGDELEAVLREVGGDAVGVSVDLERERGVLRRSDRVALRIDATALAVRVADDEELAAALTAAGLDLAASEESLSRQLDRALRLEVIASVPGGGKDRVRLRPGEVVELEASGSESTLGRLVAIGVAGAALLAGVALLTAAARRPTRDPASPPPRF